MAERTTDAGADANGALQDALAAEHAAVWGYGVVGAGLPADGRAAALAGENAHRTARDSLVALLTGRGADLVGAEAAYALPFPVVSATDAARLATTLEDGVATAWVHVLNSATEPDVRQLAVGVLGDAEVRAVGWRTRAGETPVTRAFPGLPAD